VLFLAVLVSSAAAGAFNQYWEHDLDRRMRRTRTRPFVTGKLVRSPAWVLLIAALAAGATAAAWATTNGWAAVYTLGGAVVYAIIYTVWLKRRTWWNIVIGGTGSFAVLPARPRCAGLLRRPPAVILPLTPPHPGASRSRSRTTTARPACRCCRW
jgi:protoheme IX farnesyltransferase